MMRMTLEEIATAVSGRLLLVDGVDGAMVVAGVTDTDSRKIGAGDIFVAKPGEETDGHLFVGPAATQGAALAIVEREVDVDIPQIVVADAVVALGQLATEVVARARQHDRLRVIGVTGSNGKTTTKNLLKAIFERHGNVVAPVASFNNEVGAPTTFLRVNEDTDTLIAELGASKVGEIRSLASMVHPDIAIVLMVGLAHAGEFGGIEMIEKAKSELVESLGEGGVAVLNVDDPRVARMAEKAPGRVVWFGRGERADIRAEDIEVSQSGTQFTLHTPGAEPVPVSFPVIGEHHVMNALAAAAAAHVAGISASDVARVLADVTRAERWRMEVLTREPITVINDAYNANPNSMAAALRTLAQIAEPGQRTVAVLGAMSELGDASVHEHDKLGELAVRLGISQTVVVGNDARPLYLAAVAQGSWDNEATFAEDADQAFELLRDRLRPGDLVLVKSSNSAGLRTLGDRIGDYVKGHRA